MSISITILIKFLECISKIIFLYKAKRCKLIGQNHCLGLFFLRKTVLSQGYNAQIMLGLQFLWCNCYRNPDVAMVPLSRVNYSHCCNKMSFSFEYSVFLPAHLIPSSRSNWPQQHIMDCSFQKSACDRMLHDDGWENFRLYRVEKN